MVSGALPCARAQDSDPRQSAQAVQSGCAGEGRRRGKEERAPREGSSSRSRSFSFKSSERSSRPSGYLRTRRSKHSAAFLRHCFLLDTDTTILSTSAPNHTPINQRRLRPPSLAHVHPPRAAPRRVEGSPARALEQPSAVGALYAMRPRRGRLQATRKHSQAPPTHVAAVLSCPCPHPSVLYNPTSPDAA